MQIRRLIARLSAWLAERRKQRQRQDLRSRLMRAWIRCDERGRIIRDLLADRDALMLRLGASENKRGELREIAGAAYLGSQLQAQARSDTAAARSSLESGFGGLDDPADFPQTTA